MIDSKLNQGGDAVDFGIQDVRSFIDSKREDLNKVGLK